MRDHSHWMQYAIALARKGAGFVSPNPMVGCVIVSEQGDMIGEGWHQNYGEAHAEVNAVNSVRDKEALANATVYVSLEPCSHVGKTPACALMLSKLPIKEVVIAMRDPNPKVDGKGVEQLKNAGKKVTEGILQKEAEQLNEFFVHHQTFGRPFVTLKMAQTADGFIAAADGDSQWISGKQARTQVHRWRSVYDAVLVGRNTVMADNPSLTVRHVSGRQPYRIVVDGPYELPKSMNVFSDKFEEKTMIVTWNASASATDADPMLKVMQQNYFRGDVIQVGQAEGHTDMRQAFKKIGERGITSVLVEAGQQLGSALLREGLVDKLELFISPKLLGNGTRSFLGLGINNMKNIAELKDVKWTPIGNDMLLTGYF
ncbi:MAG: bifunctional diaminohydroxyphosphoribosylaminopyrimidine deaminase/5-amino-6-(5-phosphoribosylamino)uracil reductase RibD [Bacteroidota bacterium]